MATYSMKPDLFLGPVEGVEMGRALKVWWNFEDFIFSSAALLGGAWDISSYSGTGALVSQLAGLVTTLRPGILNLTTGTEVTGRAAIRSSNASAAFLFGAGAYTIEADIYITTLSDVTNTYAIRFGFGDVTSGDFVDGAHFEYSDAGSTPNWYKCTASNSTRTKTDTTVAAVAGAWTRLKVVVNAAGTSVEYFINGTSVGVVTTNIPTGTGRETGGLLSIVKSAGTTARTVNTDWTWLHIDLAVSR